MDKNKEPLIHITKRSDMPQKQAWLIRLFAIVAALIVCAIVTTLTTGLDPISVFSEMLDGNFGSERKVWILGKELAMSKLEESLALVDEVIPTRSLMREVVSESVRLGHPVYDIFYFVLARRLGATLFTLDKRLVKLCKQEGVDCVHDVSF